MAPFDSTPRYRHIEKKPIEITKGVNKLPLMSEKPATVRIKELLEEHFQRPFPMNMLAMSPALFDTSRPNIHDNKTEFVRERDTVKQIVDHLQGVIDLLVKSKEDRTTEHDDMTDRIREAIDKAAKEFSPTNTNISARDLVLKNATETGFYYTSVLIVFHMQWAYRERLTELNEQEVEFWTINNRPPNYYARTIALRFAKFYAREIGIKPTFGMSRDGPVPSTDYGRLLERIFFILEIDGDYKRAGQWAVDQITDEDLNPPGPGLFGGLFGFDADKSPTDTTRDPKDAIVEALNKGR